MTTLHGWVRKHYPTKSAKPAANDALSKPIHGLLWHTDRGSQYASDAHREILQSHADLAFNSYRLSRIRVIKDTVEV